MKDKFTGTNLKSLHFFFMKSRDMLLNRIPETTNSFKHVVADRVMSVRRVVEPSAGETNSFNSQNMLVFCLHFFDFTWL